MFGELDRSVGGRALERSLRTGGFACRPTDSAGVVNRRVRPRPRYLQFAPVAGLMLMVAFWITGVGATPIPENIAPGTSCVGLDPPTEGEIAAGFAPGPGYSGHWGVDYLLGPDGAVRAAADGEVSFSGWVVGNLAVTVDHGGGLKTSYSYLDSSLVKRGQFVRRGMLIGQAGGNPLHNGLHFSVRILGTYIDPETVVGCLSVAPSAGLRLVRVDTPTTGKR